MKALDMAGWNKKQSRPRPPRRRGVVESRRRITPAEGSAPAKAAPRAVEPAEAPVPVELSSPPHYERERSSYDGDTAIKLYLRKIGQVKLLTPLEEIELAAKIKKGDRKAREQMIKANLRLV